MAGADEVQAFPLFGAGSAVHLSAVHRRPAELPRATPVPARVEGTTVLTVFTLRGGVEIMCLCLCVCVCACVFFVDVDNACVCVCLFLSVFY